MCVDIDECKSSPCQNGGTCIDQVNTFECNCGAGFQGDSCEEGKYRKLANIADRKWYIYIYPDINECDPSPCQNGGTCIDLVSAFDCQCIAGFEGDRCEIGESDKHVHVTK